MNAARILPLIILRPEPGASATARRAADLGLSVVKLPLFTIEPAVWRAPDPALFDRLLLTSANAVRHAGAELAGLMALPCWCVGEATASAARDAGMWVERVGDADAASLLAGSSQPCRLLWLAGEAHSATTLPSGFSVKIHILYRAIEVAINPEQLAGPAAVLVHSEAAARRLAALAPERSSLTLIAISTTVARAAGDGWKAVHICNQPRDIEMVAMAAKLCHDSVQPL